MSSLFTTLAKCEQRSLRVINIFGFRLFNYRNISHAAGNTPIITTVAFFNLKFLRTHPCAIICTIFTNGMVQQAAIFLFTFFLTPRKCAPFKLQLHVIIFIFFFGGYSAPIFTGNTDNIFTVILYYSKNVTWVVI